MKTELEKKKQNKPLTLGDGYGIESIYLTCAVRRGYFLKVELQLSAERYQSSKAPSASPQANSHLSRLNNLPVKYHIEVGMLTMMGERFM